MGMNPAELVRSRVLQIAAVVAAVSNRVYVLTFPQSAVWPAIRVTQVSESEDYFTRGSVGFRRARVQVDVVAVTYTEAAGILANCHGSYVDGIASGLTGFRGEINGAAVAGMYGEGRRDLYDDGEPALVRLSRDYGVLWREA